MAITNKELLTALELAERYQVSPRTIRRWARSGVLPNPLSLTGATVRWYAEEIAIFEEWQASRRECERAGLDPNSVGATFAEYVEQFDRRLCSRSVASVRGEA